MTIQVSNTTLQECERALRKKISKVLTPGVPLEVQFEKRYTLNAFNSAAIELLQQSFSFHKGSLGVAEFNGYVALIEKYNPGRSWTVLGPHLKELWRTPTPYLCVEFAPAFIELIRSCLPNPVLSIQMYADLEKLKNREQIKFERNTNNTPLGQHIKTLELIQEALPKHYPAQFSRISRQPQLVALNMVIEKYLTKNLSSEQFKKELTARRDILECALFYIDVLNHRKNYASPDFSQAEFELVIGDIRDFIKKGHRLFSSAQNLVEYMPYFDFGEKGNFTNFFHQNQKFITKILSQTPEKELLSLCAAIAASAPRQKQFRVLLGLPNINNPSYWEKILTQDKNWVKQHQLLCLSTLSATERKVNSGISLSWTENNSTQLSAAMFQEVIATFSGIASSAKLSILLSQKMLEIELNSPGTARSRPHKI